MRGLIVCRLIPTHSTAVVCRGVRRYALFIANSEPPLPLLLQIEQPFSDRVDFSMVLYLWGLSRIHIGQDPGGLSFFLSALSVHRCR